MRSVAVPTMDAPCRFPKIPLIKNGKLSLYFDRLPRHHHHHGTTSEESNHGHYHHHHHHDELMDDNVSDAHADKDAKQVHASFSHNAGDFPTAGDRWRGELQHGHESFIDAAILGPLAVVREIILLAGRQVGCRLRGEL
jgi:hypothetical protein